MKPLGDGFIRLIRMIIAPIIFATCRRDRQMGDMKNVVGSADRADLLRDRLHARAGHRLDRHQRAAARRRHQCRPGQLDVASVKAYLLTQA